MCCQREPLGTKSVNVATVRPTVSKLPALTPRSRLPTPGMKQKQTFSICGEKRKASGSPVGFILYFGYSLITSYYIA